jgi:tetratricopeptide (TPR) repeat protein
MSSDSCHPVHTRDEPSGSNRRSRTAWKFAWRTVRGIGGLGAAFLAAVLLLALVEVILRVAGYGVSTSPLVRRTIAGQEYSLPNREYFRQFFSLPMDTILPWDQYEFQVPVVKRPDAFRIFVFGSSAANGAPPDCAYAFCRMLDAMLGVRFPSVRFEVYNVAVSGTNSNVMYPAAKACASLQPDAFVIYMGNNEMCGPFGAQSWLTHQYTSSLAVIRAKTWVSGLRLVQVFGGYQLFRGRSAVTNIQDLGSWYCSIDPASVHAQTVYRHYEQNLSDMCRAAASAKAAAILCTVASNLVYWEPSSAMRVPSLPVEDMSSHNSHRDAGLEFDKAGAFPDAAACYEKALAIYDQSAELCHRLGYCYLRMGRCEEAFRLLHRALDLDWCVVRANGYANRAVTQVASAWAGSGVYLADAERAVAEGCPCGVPGIDRFYDAVHLNSDGNYRIAACVYDQVLKVLAGRFPDLDIASAAPLPQSECESLIGMSPWVKHSHTVNTYAMQPEGTSLTTLRRNQALKERSENLGRNLGPNSLQDTLESAAQAISRRRDDPFLRSLRVQMLMSQGNSAEALVEVEKAIDALGPTRNMNRLRVQLLMGTGRAEESRRALDELLRWYPDDPEGLFMFAQSLEHDGRTDEALECYRKASTLNPALELALESEGHLLKKLGRTAPAIEAYRKALEAQPRMFERYDTLHEFLHETKIPGAAETEWRAIAERFPHLPLPRIYLAAALEQRGAVDEAAALYRKAEEDAPGDAGVQAALAQVREAKGDFPGALAAATRALALVPADFMAYERLDTLLIERFAPEMRVERWRSITREQPGLAHAYAKLGKALDAAGDRPGAIAALEKSLQLDANDREAKESLERLRQAVQDDAP